MRVGLPAILRHGDSPPTTKREARNSRAFREIERVQQSSKLAIWSFGSSQRAVKKSTYLLVSALSEFDLAYSGPFQVSHAGICERGTQTQRELIDQARATA